MRDYGKVYSTFWSSETMRSLTEDGRMLALYLLTSPHCTIAGAFRLPDGYACEDLQWSHERVAKGFVELLSKGFANRCETTKWVWICKHLEWNPPENPNQRKSAVKVAQSIPDECCWKLDFMRVCGPLLGVEQSQKANPCETLSQGFLNQKQEQEQEQEQEKKEANASLPETCVSDPPAKPPLPDCPVEEIIALYHEHMPDNPRVRVTNSARKGTIKARWREAARLTCKPFGYATRDDGLAAWGAFFETCGSSRFLTGHATPQPGKPPFIADIDFLMSPSGFAKCLENKYHREAA